MKTLKKRLSVLGVISLLAFSFLLVATPQKTHAGYAQVVDNTSSGFQKSGPNVGWKNGPACYPINGNRYYGPNFIYTLNATNTTENSATWTATNLPSGKYAIYVYIPSCYATTTNATYEVEGSGGSSLGDYIVNQNASSGWIQLKGTYINTAGDFYLGGSNTVRLADNTGEPYMSRYIGFDAVMWVLES